MYVYFELFADCSICSLDRNQLHVGGAPGSSQLGGLQLDDGAETVASAALQLVGQSMRWRRNLSLSINFRSQPYMNLTM